MKTRMFVSILILVSAILVTCDSYATDKKVTKRDYRFFSGTWINEEYNSHFFEAKKVVRRDGTWEGYSNLSDTGKHNRGHYIITDKWTDSEGNVWYKQHVWQGVIVEGHPTWYQLDKFSNSGKVWENIQLTGDYPIEIDKNHPMYRIYYRQE